MPCTAGLRHACPTAAAGLLAPSGRGSGCSPASAGRDGGRFEREGGESRCQEAACRDQQQLAEACRMLSAQTADLQVRGCCFDGSAAANQPSVD